MKSSGCTCFLMILKQQMAEVFTQQWGYNENYFWIKLYVNSVKAFHSAIGQSLEMGVVRWSRQQLGVICQYSQQLWNGLITSEGDLGRSGSFNFPDYKSEVSIPEYFPTQSPFRQSSISIAPDASDDCDSLPQMETKISLFPIQSA